MKHILIAAAAAVLLLVYALCCTASRAEGKNDRGPVRRLLAWLLLGLFLLAVLAGIVAITTQDRLDLIRATKDMPLPESVKTWIWGWR